MTKERLTEEDFIWAAKELGCELAAIKAVDYVESKGTGFLPGTTEPIILFERHLFHRYTKGRFTRAETVNISNPVPGGYKGGRAEHVRLQAAAKLDRDAALSSASWGRFQILGVNHDISGHDTLQGFINAMYNSERAQLEAFVVYIKSRNLVRFMNAKDWAGFAYRYNGKNYAQNRYDTKLASAYKNFKEQERLEKSEKAKKSAKSKE